MQDNSIARRFGPNKAKGDDAPPPNREQRRAMQRHQKSQQRRGQKAYDRDRRAAVRAEIEDLRKIRRELAAEGVEVPFSTPAEARAWLADHPEMEA